MHIHVYPYVCVYLYTCVYVCTHKYIYAYTHTCMSEFVNTDIQIFIYIYMMYMRLCVQHTSMCVYAYMYASMYKYSILVSVFLRGLCPFINMWYTYIYIYIYICTYTYAHAPRQRDVTHRSGGAQLRWHARVHARVCVREHTLSTRAHARRLGSNVDLLESGGHGIVQRGRRPRRHLSESHGLPSEIPRLGMGRRPRCRWSD